MNSIVIAVAVVSIIGFVCAALLAVASKVMAVPTDERFGPVRECLPGANCGACGYAGCDAYAQALISGEETATNLCVPGGSESAGNIASVLGVECSEVVPMTAHVRCAGNCGNTQDKYEYASTSTCKAVKMFFGGKGTCAYGCLGLGDCAAVCPENAICIENGIAHVDPRRCIGCGLCAKTCPNKVIEIIPKAASVTVDCSNHDKGPAAMKVCKASCIGCMKCQKTCPNGAISVTNFLASIDYSKCTGCGLCADACPKKCIEKR